MPKFRRIKYKNLNSRQKEIFNFQKVSGLLAEYGYAALRLTDDWNGADFLAVHVDGNTMLRVQLKSRLTFSKRYKNQNLWVCFRYQDLVYMYPHDSVLKEALVLTNIENTKSWKRVRGTYSFPSPPSSMERVLAEYCLGREDDPVI